MQTVVANAVQAARWPLRLALVGALFVLLLPLPVRADGIYIRPGPDGEIQITTPWGDYAAYDEGGGYYWVGTQREFDKLRVIGTMQGNGMRLSTVGDPNVTATFTEAGSFHTSVGSIALDEIVPSVDFHVRFAPPNPNNARQVSVLWIQRSSTVVGCLFYNPRTGQILTANESEEVDHEWRSTAFAMPRAWLTEPVRLIFFGRGFKPGIVPLRSITSSNYRYEIIRAKMLSDNGVSAQDDLAQIKQLQRLDPTLKSVVRQEQAGPAHILAGAVASAAPTPTPLPTPIGGTWDGVVTDAHGAQAELLLSFSSGKFFELASAGGRSDSGAIVDLQSADLSTISFVLIFNKQPGCTYRANARLDANGHLLGNYKGCGGNSGTFTLAKQ